MNTKKENCFQIFGGPNRDVLFDACKYAYDEKNNIEIRLSVALGYTMPPDNPGSAYVGMAIKNIVIDSIQHEDGSGERLNLHGHCLADIGPAGDCVGLSHYSFEAYYDVRNRKGWITFF